MQSSTSITHGPSDAEVAQRSGRFSLPRSQDWVVPRERVTARLMDQVARHRLIWMLGCAGSGKTTAALDLADTARREGRSVAWLRIDASDRSPRRLLDHLEKSLTAAGAVSPARTLVPDTAGPEGLVEQAWLLGERTTAQPLLVVLDEVENLWQAPEALPVLSMFLRALGSETTSVLSSRRALGLQLGSGHVGLVGRVTDAELALDLDEVDRLAQGWSVPEDEARTAHADADGWVAGVVLQLSERGHHGVFDPDRSERIDDYLGSEVMAHLTESEAWFLTATSVLEEVTSEAAAHLGLAQSAEFLAQFRQHRVPANIGPGETARVPPLFRRFLRRRLHSCDRAREIHSRLAEWHLSHDRPELAVEALLAAGDTRRAAQSAEVAIPPAIARGEVSQIAHWLERLDPDDVRSSSALSRGQLTVHIEREEWTEGASTADRILALREMSPIPLPLDPELAGVIAVCFTHVGRHDDEVAVLEQADDGNALASWRVALALDSTDSDAHYRDRPRNRGDVIDGMLHRFDFMHGRLSHLIVEPAEPWRASRSSRIAALQAVGRLAEAQNLLAEWPQPDVSPAMARIRVELLADQGEVDEALAVLVATKPLAESSSPYSVALHLLQEASLALRGSRDVTRARRALDAVSADPRNRQHRRVVEQFDLWSGLAGLIAGDNGTALDHLQRSHDFMQTWDRQLLLPYAGVYLAEAAWRAGDESLADRAADTAMRAAGVQGSDHLLLQALRQFPQVLSRRLDADRVPDPAWLRLGRAVLPRRGTLPARTATRPRVLQPTVRVRDLGPAGIELNQRTVDVRLSRSLDLIAYLAANRGQVNRKAVLNDLFEGRCDDAAGAYLRRAIGALRDCIGHDCIDPTRGSLTWIHGSLSSDADEVRERAQEARALRCENRLDAMRAALDLVRGDYLPDNTSDWAQARRSSIGEVVLELRLDAAETAYEVGDLVSAQEYVEQVLALSSYRERAWQLAMRIAGELGDSDQVLEVYLTCRDTLAEIPAEPTATTTRLLDQLRR